MERINHIDIIQIRSCCFISKIHWMLQRNIPDWESLKLRITCFNTALMLMVQLRQTCCHLTTSRSRSCHNDQWTLCRNIIILAEAILTDNQRNIRRITLDHIMSVCSHTKITQSLNKSVRGLLSLILCNHNTSHIKSHTSEKVDESQYFLIIGNTDIASLLVLINSRCTDCNYNFCLVF